MNKILSIFSILIALIALVITITLKNNRCTINWDFTISILAILVTILITWNIYTVIDYKNQLKDLESKIENKLIKVVENNVKLATSSLKGFLLISNLQSSSANMQVGTKNPDLAINYLTNAIEYLEYTETETKDYFFNIVDEFINHEIENVEPKNMERFIEKLIENSSVDKRMVELILTIERLRN